MDAKSAKLIGTFGSCFPLTEPLPGEVGSPTDYTFEQTALQGGFFVSGEKVTLDHPL